MKKLFSLGLAILLMASTGAFAQTATGNVLGVVTDASGAVLPGVSVAISGEAGTRTTVSGADGTFRFSDVPIGTVDAEAGATSRSLKIDGFESAIAAAGGSLQVALAVGSWAGRFGSRHQAWSRAR